MIKFKKLLPVLTFLLLLALAYPVKARAGARLFFDPAAGNYVVGDTFSVTLEIDPDSQDVYAVDSIINYDSEKLRVNEVEVENYFMGSEGVEQQGSQYEIDQENGSLSIYSFANILDISINTEGTLATITFEALADGVASVTFVCDADVDGDTAIWPPEGDEIIDCAAIGSGSYTIGEGSGDSPTPTPTATPTESLGNGGETATATPTDSELPESGIIQPLVLAITLGSLLVGLGFLGLIW